MNLPLLALIVFCYMRAWRGSMDVAIPASTLRARLRKSSRTLAGGAIRRRRFSKRNDMLNLAMFLSRSGSADVSTQRKRALKGRAECFQRVNARLLALWSRD